jgi:hypothetical protein
MSVISASFASPWDRQPFGAAVVSNTLDTMNGASPKNSMSYAPTDKASFGAAVVSKTLDYMSSPMNSGSSSYGGNMGSMNAMYDFNKSVLGPVYAGTGTILDYMV